MLIQFICSLLVVIFSLTAYFILRYERIHGYPTAPTGSKPSENTKDES